MAAIRGSRGKLLIWWDDPQTVSDARESVIHALLSGALTTVCSGEESFELRRTPCIVTNTPEIPKTRGGVIRLDLDVEDVASTCDMLKHLTKFLSWTTAASGFDKHTGEHMSDALIKGEITNEVNAQAEAILNELEAPIE